MWCVFTAREMQKKNQLRIGFVQSLLYNGFENNGLKHITMQSLVQFVRARWMRRYFTQFFFLCSNILLKH